MNDVREATPSAPGSLLPARWIVRCDWIVALAFPLVSGVLGARFGQDISGDQLMYHFYGPYAFLHDRYGQDVAAAGYGTFINPLMYVPFYAAVRLLPGVAVAFLVGAVQGLSGSLIYGIGRRILPLSAEAARAVAALCAIAGLTAATHHYELGGTHFDTQVGVLVIAGCLVALTGRGMLGMGLSGLLVGAGAGSKLTAIIHVVALLPAIVVCGRARWRDVVAAGFGMVAGLVLTAGPFMLLMERHYASPLFPHYNAFFRSPYHAIENSGDPRWAFHSLRDYVLSPLTFVGCERPVFEQAFFDARWIVFAVAAIVGVVSWRRLSAATRFLVVFVLGSYACWAILWGYLRYLAGAEALVVLAISAVLIDVARARRWAVLGAVVLAVAITATTRAPRHPSIRWREPGGSALSRLRPWYRVEAPRFDRPSEVAILLEGDIAFVIPFFQREITFVGLNNNYFGHGGKDGLLFERARRIALSKRAYHLAQQGWPYTNLVTDDEYRSLGLMVDREDCRPVATNIRPFEICPLVPYRDRTPARTAIVDTHAPAAEPLGGAIDAANVSADRVVLDGWAEWSSVRDGQRLRIYADVPIEVAQFKVVPRVDVAADRPKALLGESGFHVELRWRGAPGHLCLVSEDPVVGTHELPPANGNDCAAVRRALGDPRPARTTLTPLPAPR